MTINFLFKMVKRYFTHFNGARVFKIEDNQNSIKVFINEKKSAFKKDITTFTEEVFSSDYNHIWIGDHSYMYDGEYDQLKDFLRVGRWETRS